MAITANYLNRLFTISGTSASSASTTIIGTVNGLDKFDWFQIVAILIGGTGTAGDVAWLQFRLDPDVDVWVDWIRFPAIAAGTTYKYLVEPLATNTITAVGTGTLAAPGTVGIAANTNMGGHPGDMVRLVYTAGASTSAGATQKVYIRGWKRPK